MKRRFFAALAGLLGIHLLAVPAAGEAIPKGPKFALHIQSHAGKGVSVCDVGPVETTTPCSSFDTQGLVGVGYDLYVVIGQADSTGIGGVTFGIDYNGADGEGVDIVGTWTLCSTGLEFPSTSWPAAGSGNIVTWNPQGGCGNTVIEPDNRHATVGMVYVYAYDTDRFSITRHMLLQAGPALETANCLSVETPIPLDEVALKAGYVGFGQNGFNPCGGLIPVEPVSWGEIKTKY